MACLLYSDTWVFHRFIDSYTDGLQCLKIGKFMRYDYIIYRFALVGLIGLALVACGSESVYTNTAETDSSGDITDEIDNAGNSTTDIEQPSSVSNSDLTLSLLWIERAESSSVVGSPLISDAELIITHGQESVNETTQIKAFRTNGLIGNWALNPNNNAVGIQAFTEVAGDLNGNVYAIRTLIDDNETVRLVTRNATGELMPDYQGGGMQSRTAPSIDASGRVIFVISDNNIAVREQDGTVNLIREANIGFSHAKPAISRANIAYFTNNEEGLVGVNLTTGIRNFCSGSQPSWSSPAIAGNNNIIFGTILGRIMACAQTTTMSRVWTYPDDDLAAADANNCNPMTQAGPYDFSITGSPLIDAANNVYIRSHNGYIYALNAEGKLRWCHDTGTVPSSYGIPTGTPILTANGYLIYVDASGVSAINKDTGELALRLADNEMLSVTRTAFTTPTITPSGLLIFRSGWSLVAVQTNTSLDENAFWPKWGADLKNSGLQR